MVNLDFDLQRFAVFYTSSKAQKLKSDDITLPGSNISGTVPVSVGGTGQTILSAVSVGKANTLTTGRDILTNLESSVASNFNGTASVAPGTSGILPVSRGGTGVNNLNNITVGKANSLSAARALQVSLSSTVAANFDGSADVKTIGVQGVLQPAQGGTGKTNLGNVTVGTANSLTSAKNITASLSTTLPASFDGSGNVTVGTQGVLPISKGGTGATTAEAARASLGLGSMAVLNGPLSEANGGTGTNSLANITVGSATKAASLQTARALQVSLNSTASSNFQGNTDVKTIGVQGTLQPAQGGTGQTILSAVTVGAANIANSLSTARALQVSLNKDSATNFQGNANVTNIGIQGILQPAHGGTGQSVLSAVAVGSATSATRAASLTTARALQVSLGNSLPSNFQGNTDVKNIGVTGVLGVSNGGTGVTTINDIKAGKDANGSVISSTYLKISDASSTYLTKTDASSTYLEKSAKAASATSADSATTATTAGSLTTARSLQVSLNNTSASDFKGNANVTNIGVQGTLQPAQGGTGQTVLSSVTVGAATKATQDGSGNNIASTYLTTSAAATTYLTKSDANSTYLGKSAKAASATTADSAITATTASSLTTARSLQVSLGKTSATNFQGNANVNDIGVQGTLGVANGGTGTNNLANITVGKANTLTTARALQVSLSSTSAPTFNGTADVKNIGVTGVLPVAHGGTGQTILSAVTTGAATKASQDGSGQVITSTYATKTELSNGLATKSDKLNREYHQDFALTGVNTGKKIVLGEFQCYDTNITAEIVVTSDVSYYGVAVLATQNVVANSTTSGTRHWTVYGDAYNMITPKLYLEQTTKGTIRIYFKADAYSKIFIHIQCTPPAGGDKDIFTLVDEIPTTATMQPTNALANSFLGINANAASATKLAASKNILVNLGSTTAASFDGSASVAPGISGTLPVAHGGTGATVLSAITVGKANSLTTAHNLQVSLSNANAASFNGTADVKTIGVQGILPVANGGTGTNALTNITVGKANTLTTARALQVSLSSTGAPTFDGSADVKTIGVTGILPVANGGTGTNALANITVGKANTLTTARALQVSLSSTGAPTFNGTADVKTIGVTGILPVANGGTGTNSLADITVGKANTLTTARALQVSLSSTGAPTFNGTVDVKNIGVTGVLPIANGGTGTSSGLPITNVIASGSTSGNIDAITAFRVGSTASNKTFNIPASAIKVEYSRDNGATWIDYGLTDTQKKDLFSETRGTNVFLGKASAKTDNNVNNMLRITINPNDRYVSCNMFYLWGSTNGSTWFAKLEVQTWANHDTTTWTTLFENKQMSGWSGNNVVYFSQVNGFNRSDSQGGNMYALRFTFHQTAINANYSSACLSDIRCYGVNWWSASNDIVKSNRLYHWDADLNAYFPASITASGFNGTATKALQDGSGNNIASTYLTTTAAASNYLGKTAKAASATTADSATKATNDGSNRSIVDTYETKANAITGLSASGNTITITKGNGTTSTIGVTGSSQDLSGYLTKTEASSTYLGKSAKAASASTADSASNANYANSAGSASTADYASSANTAVQVTRTLTGASVADLLYSQIASNDYARIRVGGTADNAGYIEIATADDGNEPIYVRQYTGAFTTLARTVTLLDASGNTSFPGTVTATSFSGNIAGYAKLAGDTFTGNVTIGTTSAPKGLILPVNSFISSPRTASVGSSFSGMKINSDHISGYGADVLLQGGQQLIIASGECGQRSYLNADGVGKMASIPSGDENLYLLSDQKVILRTNCQDILSTAEDIAQFVFDNTGVTAERYILKDKEGTGIGNLFDNNHFSGLCFIGRNSASTQYGYDVLVQGGNKLILAAGECGKWAYNNTTNGGDAYIQPTSGNSGENMYIYADSDIFVRTNCDTLTACKTFKFGANGKFTAPTIVGALSGNATSATKLATGRTLKVSLNSTAASTAFDGTAAISNIGVAGTLAIANGGTGLTASPSMLTNLGSTTAANVLAASPRPGVTGTLPIANGGTGLTASPSMLTNLGSTTAANVLAASPRPGITGTLSVAHGGTGGTVTGFNFCCSENCTTAAGTAAKAIPSPNFRLTDGATICWYLSNANTHSAPTANVNGTGAKQIFDASNHVRKDLVTGWYIMQYIAFKDRYQILNRPQTAVATAS